MVRDVHQHVPGVPVLVIDDCSPTTPSRWRAQAGAEVLPLPHHLGLGGCVQAGYKLAFELGLRIRDPRGWRRPARRRATFRASSKRCKTSRLRNGDRLALRRTTTARGPAPCARWASAFSAWCCGPILGKPVHDPTSGFVGVNRRALEVFSHSFPLEYPEIEALVVLQRRRFRFEEVPCKMRPRTTGRSSITALKSLYYIVHVLLGVFVNVLKFERRLHRAPARDAALEDRWTAS